jgi:hypothetical protein
LFEARGNRYVLWTEPSEEKVLENNFLTDPDGVYEGLAHTVCDGLSLRNLKMPMAPFEQIGDWKNDYGVLVPRWDFSRTP